MSGWAALGSAVGTGLSSAWGMSHARDMQRRANKFTERMDNTKHQRNVRDLKKAGLNPILAAGQMPGSPHSAMAQGQSHDMGSSAASGSQAGSAKRLADKQLEMMDSEKAKNEAAANASNTASAYNRALAALTWEQDYYQNKRNMYFDQNPLVFELEQSSTTASTALQAARMAGKALDPKYWKLIKKQLGLK